MPNTLRAVPENNIQGGEPTLIFRRDWVVGVAKKCTLGTVVPQISVTQISHSRANLRASNS